MNNETATRQPWHLNDDAFRHELEAAHPYVQQVADRLQTHGLDVTVTPYAIRRTIADRHNWADEYDLDVQGWAVEVKSSPTVWTDEPGSHPYRRPLVYACAAWDAHTTPRAAVVLVSRPTGGMLVVPASTRPAWGRRNVWDSVRQITYHAYDCPRELLRRFCELVAWFQAGNL